MLLVPPFARSLRQRCQPDPASEEVAALPSVAPERGRPALRSRKRKKAPRALDAFLFGGPSRIRTLDLLIKSQLAFA